jgi:hypothetical protein
MPPARPAVLDARCARFDLCDVGNGDRFRARHGHAFMIFGGRWYVWTDHRWTRDGAALRRSMAAQETAYAILDEAQAVRGTAWGDEVVDRRHGRPVTRADALAAWAVKSQSAYRLRCMWEMAAPHLVWPGFWGDR